MKKLFSRHWKSSKQPRKQRKYRYNAPLHIKQKFMSVHLSKELRKKYNKRNITVRKGDKVKIVRGQFKGKTGKVVKVDLKNGRVHIEGIQNIRRDGTKTYYPILPAKLILLELDLTDKERKNIIERKTKKEK